MHCSPIFAEIVPEKSRTSVYALDRSFESVLSSFAPPVVGILSQHVYGYKPLPDGSSVSEEIATDRKNAASLAKALYSSIGVPMALCCFIYSFLYRTYPRDRERAKMEALIESEMQHLELHDSPAGVDLFNQVHLPQSDLPSGQDKTVIEMDYEKDLDDHDEKTWLYRQLTFSNMGKQ